MNLEEALNQFHRITLAEMDEYAFMNRMDTKFLFPVNMLPELLSRISKHYRILEINSTRDFPYSSTYFDTSDYLFFTQHVRGFSERYKVRYRIYETTGQSFLEVKCKNQKGRTSKWRIKNDSSNFTPDVNALQFLKTHIADTAFRIKPVLLNKFNRITLVGIETKERISFDHNLVFTYRENSIAELPYLTIAEIKRESVHEYSPFVCAVKEMRVRSTRFSKYCVGSTLVKQMPKSNLLKPKLLLLQKIKNEYINHSA